MTDVSWPLAAVALLVGWIASSLWCGHAVRVAAAHQVPVRFAGAPYMVRDWPTFAAETYQPGALSAVVYEFGTLTVVRIVTDAERPRSWNTWGHDYASEHRLGPFDAYSAELVMSDDALKELVR